MAHPKGNNKWFEEKRAKERTVASEGKREGPRVALASRSRRARVALASRSRRALVAPSLTKLRESRVAGGNAKEPPVEFQDRGPASTAKLSPLLVLSSSIYECERTVATNLYSRPRHKTRAAPPAEIKWEINFLVVSSQLSVYTCCEEF